MKPFCFFNSNTDGRYFGAYRSEPNDSAL